MQPDENDDASLQAYTDSIHAKIFNVRMLAQTGSGDRVMTSPDGTTWTK